MSAKYINNWKKKSLFSKITDLFFVILIITLLFPEGRLAVGGFVNRLKSMVAQPSLLSKKTKLNEKDFDWIFTDMDGKKLSFSETKGKVVFLNLWATWCPPCIGEMPGIQKLYNKFKDNPEVQFVLLSNEKIETVKSFMSKKNYSFPVYTSLSPTPLPFSSRSIPTSFVISRDGEIVLKEVGAVNWGGDKMENIIEDLLK